MVERDHTIPESVWLLDVVKVEPMPDFRLLLYFENGERRIFDMSPYLKTKPFLPLEDQSLFEMASIDHGTVVWPGNIDIAPETLYDESSPVARK